MAKAIKGLKALTEAFGYLDMLRESGVTNMYGAAPYLMRDLGRPREQAVKELSAWMESFSDNSPEDRALATIAKAEGRL